MHINAARSNHVTHDAPNVNGNNYSSYQSRCLFQEWKLGRNLSVRTPFRSPHKRQNNPGRCAAAWSKRKRGPKTTLIMCRQYWAHFFVSLPLHPNRAAPKTWEISRPLQSISRFCATFWIWGYRSFVEERTLVFWNDQWAHPRFHWSRHLKRQIKTLLSTLAHICATILLITLQNDIFSNIQSIFLISSSIILCYSRGNTVCLREKCKDKV